MNIWLSVYKKIKITLFNMQNKTLIRSFYANLNARYGKKVRIDKNTRVTADVVIGDYSYVNHDSSLQNCEVGKYCSISSGVNICPYNHNMSGITTHPIGDFVRETKKVIIGNDVLISLNVTIMEGIHIGDGAVIGAGAVVTHNIGAYEVWGGVPAHFIRYRIPNERLRKCLMQLQWWNMDEDKINYYVTKYNKTLEGLEIDCCKER